MRMQLSIPEVSRNTLVAALDDVDLQRWLPFLEMVDLPLGKVLSEENVTTSHVYFPTTAIVSKLHVMEDGSSAQLAVVGNEGVVGISVIMGGVSGAIRAVVLNAGKALRMRSEFFREEVNRPPVLHLLLRYIQALMSQMSHTAACNRHHVLDQQLCRWLLLSMDRTQGNWLFMTQELIATMLGVRREGVTEAAMKLQKAGLIRYARGRIEVMDRVGLERRACECYGVVKRAYDRLLPRCDDHRLYLPEPARGDGAGHGLAREPYRILPYAAMEPVHARLDSLDLGHRTHLPASKGAPDPR